METVRKVIKTPKNHEIRLRIPEHIPENEPVEIIMVFKKKSNRFDEKMRQMQKAAQDPQFIQDLQDVSSDFEQIDLDSWPE